MQAYVDKDRALIDSVIGKPYSFTSPLDKVTKPILTAADYIPSSPNGTHLTCLSAALERYGHFLMVLS